MRSWVVGLLVLGACQGTSADGDGKDGVSGTTPEFSTPPFITGSEMTVFEVDWMAEPALLDDPSPSMHSHFSQAVALDGGGAVVMAYLDEPDELAVYRFDAVGDMSTWRTRSRGAAVDARGLITDRDDVRPGLIGSEDEAGPDPAFGLDGTIETGFDVIRGVLVAGDRIVVGGSVGSRAFDRQGVADPAWGVDGVGDANPGVDGRLFLDGRLGTVGGATASLYDAAGDLVASLEVPGLRSVEPGPAGGWLVAGDSLHVLLPDGQPDLSFGTDGVWTPAAGVVTAAVARPDGGFLLAVTDLGGTWDVPPSELRCLDASGVHDPCLRLPDESRDSSWVMDWAEEPWPEVMLFGASVAPDGEHVVLGGYGGSNGYNVVMQMAITTQPTPTRW